ncbi:MAG: M23 family metallopeptidase [Oscillospiraceae bacterium]
MARMKSAQTVYYGPAYSGYPSVGSVSANESVEYFWTEGAWCYICYSVSGTSNKKCGYVPDTAVNYTNENPLVDNANSGTRYIRSGGTTYTGPGSSGYVSAGSVDAGESVMYTGYKYNNYALIEYSVGSTSTKKRAWYLASDMTKDPVSSGSTFYDYTANGWTVTNPWNGAADHPGHLGLDLERPSNINFYALADGVVIAKSRSCLPSNGYTIVLQHNIGGKQFFSFYAHMDSSPNLSVGDRVTCGTPIHVYGASGVVTGPHLHLGVYTGGINDDQYGYYRVNNNSTYFNDYGLGYFDYNDYRFFDPAQVIATNGGIIC